MTTKIRRIAISLGGGYVPGLAAVVQSCAQAAQERGWEVVGIRDGFDGLLYPERFDGGGVIAVDPVVGDETGSLLGTGARNDPFRLQQVSAEGLIEQVDASERVQEALRQRGIDAVVAIVGGSAMTGSHALAVMWRLSRQGLRCVCIPKSVENDLAATGQPFGYDSARAFAADTLRRVGGAARDQGRVALVEVPGQYAGWLALEAGLAAGADAILIPELPYRADRIARHIDAHAHASLIVVSQGAVAASADVGQSGHVPGRQVSGEVNGGQGTVGAVIHRSGLVARAVLEEVQRFSRRELFPLVLDQLVRAGAVSGADRILGAAYGAAAVASLADGHHRHLIAARHDCFENIDLAAAVNQVRLVDAKSPALASARSLGVCLG